MILQKAKKNEICDAVILNVDTDTLSSKYDDFEDLPSDIVSILNLSNQLQGFQYFASLPALRCLQVVLLIEI